MNTHIQPFCHDYFFRNKTNDFYTMTDDNHFCQKFFFFLMSTQPNLTPHSQFAI